MGKGIKFNPQKVPESSGRYSQCLQRFGGRFPPLPIEDVGP